MGVDSRKPPLPAPTESMDETSGVETEVATNVTTRTDKTSYEVPEDGSPITISTQKITSGKEGGRPGHHRQKSQTSLLIEYFEAGKSGDKVKSRPSVRVKVTPSATKKGKSGHDAIQFTAIGKDRKPSYTRRISLGSSKNVETGLAPTEGTEISHSSESNISGRPPVEIEVLNNGSDLSNGKSSRGLLYAQNESNVSSMPPDSMLEGSNFNESELSRDTGRDEDATITEKNHLQAPVRSRSRSTSRDRLTQKVMEKLGQTTGKTRKSSRSSRERSISKEYDAEGYPKERRRRSSKSHRLDEDSTISGAESSLLNPGQSSYRSGTSQGSRVTNNPKLLEMVEDTIKRMILPEINQIKEDQRHDRNVRSFDSSRASLPRDGYEDSGLERRVSKSSSTPNIASKPKVVLNRDGDDPGTVLSRGDSERKKTRKSSREYTERPPSRRSSGRHSRHSDRYDDEETENIKHKSSKGDHGLRNAAAAGLAGGILTAAALKHHDSQDDVHSRRKKRSKSQSTRSRSNSIADTTTEAYSRKEDIPPLPMASGINASDITRDSIVSTASTEHPSSRGDVMTPIHEVSRGSVGDAMSPVSSRTPTRTPVSGFRGLGMSHVNQSIDSPNGGISTKARMAALAAAGLAGAGAAAGADEYHDRHVDADGYGSPSTKRSVASPAQSVSSLKKQFEEEESLVLQGLRPKSAASRSSAGRLREKSSRTSQHSARSSPTTQRLAQSRKHSQNISGDEFVTPLEKPDAGFLRSGTSTPGTPTNGESVDDWYERQHQLNMRYRDSLDETENRDSYGQTTNRDSYATDPYPEDKERFAYPGEDKRETMYTDDSFGMPPTEGGDIETEQNVKGVGAIPMYQTPAGVESNVASLMDPSTLSSDMTGTSPQKQNGGTFAERLREMHGSEKTPAMYDGSTLSQSQPSQDRWAALKGHARNISATTSQDKLGSERSMGSPKQSPARSLRKERSIEQPVMGASGLPVADDPLPEIGHFDDTRSELSTNPSIVEGPLGGDATGRNHWPYSPSPQPNIAQKELGSPDSRSLRSGKSSTGDGLLAAAAGGAAALAAAHAAKQPSVADEEENQRVRGLTGDMLHAGDQIDREATPTGSPAAFRDEGYVTDAYNRSTGGMTPQGLRQYSKEDFDEFNRAMDAQSLGEDDPFTGSDPRHSRQVSGNSHGMASPLYDSSTGKGLDKIQSKDIVALMDHLTVRDAQRNARDTEILVTLVRSAAEMRQSFDEMKAFIKEQDRLIMANTDRDAEVTVAKVLGGPRPQPPPSSPRTPRGPSQEEIQAKRKGVLRRALKGLTGGRKTDDLARVEDMLNQILDNVEDLKQGGVPARPANASYSTNTLDSYERLRAAPDSGYEPEGQAGTSSTPSHSGHFSVPAPKGEKQQFHSGYDGRRGSVNRVSTVLEGDEDEELTPDEDHLLHHQFENNERLLTPTQERYQQQRGFSPSDTPYHGAEAFNGTQANNLTPKTAEKQRKHKSNGSSIFGAAVPKISRWSKTTSSSAVPDPSSLDSPNAVHALRPLSDASASRSGSQLDQYDDEPYELRDDDRLRPTQSLAREEERDQPVSKAETRSMRSQGSRITRTPSPLIPSEASLQHRDVEYEQEESPIQEDMTHEFPDPKYQAHRNSLLLQHPQPRQGTTGRHQNTLETKAEDYDDPSQTNSDLSQRTVSDFDPLMWGSSGTAALARNRFSQAEPLSPASQHSGGAYGKVGKQDDEPLVPQRKPVVPPKVYEPEPEPEQDWEPQYSNSGFSKGGYYSSPWGSGHLLEPIEEVRYSLETDRNISPEPQVAQAIDMRSSARKITGPRPMGSRSPAPREMPRVVENSGTVRRKPVAGSEVSADSLESDN